MNRLGAPLSPALRIGIDGREVQGRPTGVGRYLRSLLRRWEDATPHTFILYASEAVDVPLTSTRIQIRVLSGSHPLVFEQRSLPAAVASDRVDVLLSPAYSCPLLTSVPRVTAMHDLSFFARPEEFTLIHGLRRRIMARLSARASSSLLACSHFTRGEIERHLGAAAAAKTVVVPLGPDDDLPQAPSREASRAALGLGEADFYLLTVGTILARRNIPVLVRAVARLAADRPGLRLGIVGENRTHPFEDPRVLARDLGCEGAVRLSGFVPDADIARHYAAADAAIFLSEYEGFGLPALEAMARGVPTIIANRGSLNEMFAPGALVIEPAEADVADGLRRVLFEPTVAQDLRLRGLEHAKAFSWERTAEQTLRILERAAA